MGAHCYFIYNGEQKSSYHVEFKLFDDNYISFVTYDNTFLDDENSWGISDTMIFDSSSDSLCKNIKDPFQERISCINKIKNCMYCENENTCKKCNYGFALFSEQCLPSIQFKNNLKYFTSDNGTNYNSCSSMVSNCEECSYEDFSFNKFHCTKCSNGFNLSENYECVENKNKLMEALKIIILGFSNFEYTPKNKIVNFFTYMVCVKQKVNIQKISIKTNIKYKIRLRSLQDSETKDSLCILVNNKFDNQNKYKCTIDTNGEEIENIEVDKNIEIKDIEISDIEVSPIAIHQISSLQNIGEEDHFSKMLYILNNSTTVVNNDDNEFNITGYIEDNDFHYTKLDLEISLLFNSDEILENISCDSIKIKDNFYTLKCSTNEPMTGQLNNAFSNLGNDNLIINFLEGEKKNLNFNGNIKIIKTASSGGVSIGGMIGIVIPPHTTYTIYVCSADGNLVWGSVEYGIN